LLIFFSPQKMACRIVDNRVYALMSKDLYRTIPEDIVYCSNSVGVSIMYMPGEYFHVKSYRLSGKVWAPTGTLIAFTRVGIERIRVDEKAFVVFPIGDSQPAGYIEFDTVEEARECKKNFADWCTIRKVRCLHTE